MPVSKLSLFSIGKKSAEALFSPKRCVTQMTFHSSSYMSEKMTNKSGSLLAQEQVASGFRRSYLIPIAVLCGIGGGLIFLHLNDEKRSIHKEFDERIMGLTGPVGAVRQMAHGDREYFKKVEEDGDDYLVESSHNMYLMNPNLEIIRTFGLEYNADQLSEEINKIIHKSLT